MQNFSFVLLYCFDSSLPVFPSLTVCCSKNRLSSAMNPVYSPVQPGAPYGNPKNMAFPGTHKISLNKMDEKSLQLEM